MNQVDTIPLSGMATRPAEGWVALVATTRTCSNGAVPPVPHARPMNLKGPTFLASLGASLLLTACSVEPEPIAYGSDACVFCRMTIVDKTHAAQLVTKKGKQFKYDAIECLVQNLPEWTPDTIAHLKVADFAHPGAMIDAENATYLISPGIRSPMGANLSAFADRESAGSARDEYTGELLTWTDLQDRLKADFAL